jgi:hypothetical protein
MPHSILNCAIEKKLVRHNGRAIQVYQLPTPGFYGSVSEDILQRAAEKAYRRGWRKVVLTWGDMLDSCCFDEGYCWLLAVNPAMATSMDCHYKVDHILCDMDRSGEVHRPPQLTAIDDDYSPFEFDGMDLAHF